MAGSAVSLHTKRRCCFVLQGIKFYEPEVVGDTPEAVEFRGMQNLVAAAQEHLGFRDGKLIFSADGQVMLLPHIMLLCG